MAILHSYVKLSEGTMKRPASTVTCLRQLLLDRPAKGLACEARGGRYLVEMGVQQRTMEYNGGVG